jgi:hypothetical protein
MSQLINIVRRLLTWLWTTRTGRVTLVGLLAAAGAGIYLVYWLVSPLFIDEVVDEQFPLTTNAVIPADMTREKAQEVMEEAAGVKTEVSESMTQEMQAADVVELKSGMFTDADAFHEGMGTATLYRLEDGSHVLRFEDFRVTNGPDLRVLVSPHPNPAGRGDISDAGYTELDGLKGNVGSQNYFLPDDLSPDDVNSVIIYCKPFRVVFSTAPLSEK